MFKALALVGLAILIGGVSYSLGVFGASFRDGICYSEVIHGIAKHAESSIEIGGSVEVQRFQEFVKALPLYGYETSCNELREMIETRIRSNKTMERTR